MNTTHPQCQWANDCGERPTTNVNVHGGLSHTLAKLMANEEITSEVVQAFLNFADTSFRHILHKGYEVEQICEQILEYTILVEDVISQFSFAEFIQSLRMLIRGMVHENEIISFDHQQVRGTQL